MEPIEIEVNNIPWKDKNLLEIEIKTEEGIETIAEMFSQPILILENKSSLFKVVINNSILYKHIFNRKFESVKSIIDKQDRESNLYDERSRRKREHAKL